MRGRLMAGGLLVAVAVAGLIFALPFAFPTPPPIITRVTATALFSPNDDGRRDVARVNLRVREAAEVTLEVRDDDVLVRTLLDGGTQPRGPVTAQWDGTDEAGRTVPDGTYSLRLRARAGAKRFNVSRTIRIDTSPPRFTRMAVRSAALQPVGRGRCRLVLSADDDVRVRFGLRAVGATTTIRAVGPRPLRAGRTLVWRWDGRRGNSPGADGLYRIDATIRDAAGNLARRAATCWRADLVGTTRPARPRSGQRIGAQLRDAAGRALPLGTPVALALYERAAIPGRDPGRPIGPRVGGRARGTLASATVRLPLRTAPRRLWLVAETPAGRALIPVGGL